MGYSQRLLDVLRMLNAEEGDTVLVKDTGREYRGILMPHHEFSDPDVVVVKLKSGYNVGVKTGPGTTIEVISKVQPKERKPHHAHLSKDKKTVAVLGTGGTIASYVDYRTGAVHPALSADDLVAAVPEIGDICNVRSEVIFSIFSENMTVEHWQTLAGAVAEKLNDGVEGCIVPHGTDTMGYTSAALSFMLEGLNKPVILVGAQRSSDRPSTDAHTNLVSAARFIVEGDVAGVHVLMHETSSDTTGAIHLGTKVRKMHTSRRDAFHSVNCSPVARIGFEGGIEYLSGYRKKSAGKVTLKGSMDPNVALLQFFPGMSPTAFASVLSSHHGVVFAGSGLGHVSKDMVAAIDKAVKAGTNVVMTSQCLYGRVNLNVYNTGRDLITAGAIPAEDMLPETAYVKLMWVLGQTSDDGEVRRLMMTDLRGEITERRQIDD
ncbi:MAG TPA: Glu-tRNA(Gln) amidotransferase subunit GatD [Methanomassiliicoccales archaeon]